MRLLHMDTVRSWGNRDLASFLTLLNQTEFQKNWADDTKDIILKPNEAIWFPYGCRLSWRSRARVRSPFRRRPFLCCCQRT